MAIETAGKNTNSFKKITIRKEIFCLTFNYKETNLASAGEFEIRFSGINESGIEF